MRKLEALSPWLFFCLGVVFLGVSILVVPQKAFAQDGGSCSDACCGGCYGAAAALQYLGILLYRLLLGLQCMCDCL